VTDSRRQTKTGGKDAVDGWIQGDLALSVGRPPTAPPDGFVWRRLTDLARLESGHTPSRKIAGYWSGGDIPWITVKEAAAHHGQVIFETDEYITAEGEQNSSARLLPANTVCLTRTGSLGFVVAMGRPMTTSQGLVNWVCGPELDWRYLKYILLGESDSYNRFSWGSAHQTIYFPEVKAFHVLVPPIAEQRAIVGVLGALDDKIESNRRLATTSELLSRVLLEAVLGDSSEVVTLGELVRFRNSERRPLSALQRAEMSGARVYPYFGATGVFDYVDDYLFDDLTALVGEDGSVVNDDGSPVVQLAWGKYWVNNHAHVLVGEGIATELLYVALKRSDVRPLVTGAVQAKISMGNLRTLELELPAAVAREALGDELRLILGRMRRAVDETVVLQQTRDALLPELLAGRIRVRDAEKVVEGAV